MTETTTSRRAAALRFATRLNDLLGEKGMKRRELARRLSAQSKTGVSFETARTNVHRLLRGTHYPNESTRREVAAALEVDPSEFEEEALAGDPFRGADGATPASRRAGRVAGDGAAEGAAA